MVETTPDLGRSYIPAAAEGGFDHGQLLPFDHRAATSSRHELRDRVAGELNHQSVPSRLRRGALRPIADSFLVGDLRNHEAEPMLGVLPFSNRLSAVAKSTPGGASGETGPMQ